MRHLSYRTLYAAALVFSLLSSAGCSNVSGVLTPPPAPPLSLSPCLLPYPEKAGQLPAQAGLDQQLDGPGMVELWKSDVGQYNGLYPKFNANIDYAAQSCVAKPASAVVPSPLEKPKPSWLQLW